MRWAKMATSVPTGETFVETELTDTRTGERFARTGANSIRLFKGETIGKPDNFVEICGMTGMTCALTGAICIMIAVTSGMIAAAFDATTKGNFSSAPRGRAAGTAAGESCRRF